MKELSHAIFEKIKLEDIKKIYSGRCGCACGCRGIYREGKKGKRIFNNMKQFVKGKIIKHFDGSDEWIICCDDEEQNRTYTIYIPIENKINK